MSEFLTTSCRTHLSFMDPGPEGKVFAKSYEFSIDSFEELDAEEWLHGLQIAEDGKGEQASHCCGVANAKLTCKPVTLNLSASICHCVLHTLGFSLCVCSHLTLHQLTLSG